MNKYEGIIILQPQITVEKVEQILDEIKMILPEVETDLLGLKKLAYEVKGNKEGYFIQLSIKAEQKDIIILEKYYREEIDIIKFITYKEEGDM